MGVSSPQRLGVVALPYKAAEPRAGEAVWVERNHNIRLQGRGGGPEAKEPLGRPTTSSGPLPASDVRSPEGANSKEYG